MKLLGLERNARICLGFFPLWAVPYTIYTYYLSLFLIEEGLSSTGIASLMTVANVSALVFSLFAAPIVDRMGRRNATFVFDILSSALPCLLYLISGNIVVALIAQAVSGMNRIMSTGFYLLMIENTSESNSVNSMNIFNVILVGAGLTTPLAGFVVSKMGLLAGERLFLIISLVMMTAQATARHFMVRETETGMAIMRARERFSFKETAIGFGKTVRYMIKNRNVRSAMIINSLIYVYYTVGTTISLFFTPYFSEHRNLSGVTLGLVGGIYAGGTLFSMIVINPRVRPRQLYPYTIISGLVSILGFVLLILCPLNNTILLFAAIILISVSYGALKTIADSLLALEMTNEYSSGLYAISFILSSVLGIIAIQILQALYSKNPNWLFGSSAILIAMVLIVAIQHRIVQTKTV
ncbi:MAG: MFS transporter [Spirochaetales bacterium]|nr:MFS transporter [Spirochaetales bacterium]